MASFSSFLVQPSAGRALALNGGLLDIPDLNSDNALILLVISWFAVHPDVSFAKIQTLAFS